MSTPTRQPVVWRRNLIGAAVAGIAAAIIVVTQLYPRWSDYWDTVVPAHVVAPRASLMAYGQTWRLGEIRHVNAIPGAGKLPSGTTLFVATIDRSGAPTLDTCAGILTDGARRWRAQGLGLFAAPLADDATALCGDPGRMQFSFLLPSDAAPTSVDIIDYNERILLRLML